MSASETTLSTAMQGLDVESGSLSAFNTPTTGTPILQVQLSAETLNLLTEVSTALKKQKSRIESTKDDVGQKGIKRKRFGEASTSNNNQFPLMKDKYPPELKPIYLKAKALSVKKLALATSIHQVKEDLKNGRFPPQSNFRSSPPTSDNDSFRVGWVQMVNQCKRSLTNIWIDELSRKYTVIKAQLQQAYSEMEQLLSPEQLVDIKATLNDRYKKAASGAMSKRMRLGSPKKRPTPTSANNNKKQPQQKGRRNKQVQNLLKGLAQLLKN